MALQGTLKDFGVADIFQLIGQQQKTGVLHLVGRDEEVHVAFKDGNVVRAESASRKKKELLGNLLVQAELVTAKQLEDALEEQKRTLKRLGDVLVAAGTVTREQLRAMTQLQTTETLYRLFTWKSGTYAFEATEVEFDPDAATPIRSENVVMEGFRRVDEWPLIRKRITSSAVHFARLKELAESRRSPVPTAPDDVDRALDDAFSGGSAPARAIDWEDELGPNERLVFTLAAPLSDVQSIVDRSRLGEFEACKALLSLVNAGFLKALPPVRRAAADPTALGAARERWRDRMVVFSGRLAMAVLLLAGAVAVATQVNVEAVAFSENGAHELTDASVKRLLGRFQRGRVEAALAVWILDRGESPSSLAELVESGFLADEDLRYPWAEPYYYRKAGARQWLLLPPLR